LKSDAGTPVQALDGIRVRPVVSAAGQWQADRSLNDRPVGGEDAPNMILHMREDATRSATRFCGLPRQACSGDGQAVQLKQMALDCTGCSIQSSIHCTWHVMKV